MSTASHLNLVQTNQGTREATPSHHQVVLRDVTKTQATQDDRLNPATSPATLQPSWVPHPLRPLPGACHLPPGPPPASPPGRTCPLLSGDLPAPPLRSRPPPALPPQTPCAPPAPCQPCQLGSKI